MQPSILIDLQQSMLNEGGDFLSSYLSDMPMPVVPTRHFALTVRMLSASTAQRVTITAQLFPDDDGHSCQFNRKRVV